jgi:hypothetical protein
MADDDSGREELDLTMRLTQMEDRLTALEAQGKGVRDYLIGQAYGVPRSHRGQYPPPTDPDSPEAGPGYFLSSDDDGEWLSSYHC